MLVEPSWPLAVQSSEKNRQQKKVGEVYPTLSQSIWEVTKSAHYPKFSGRLEGNAIDFKQISNDDTSY